MCYYEDMHKRQSGFGILELLIILLIILMLIFAGWWVWKKKHDSKDSGKHASTSESSKKDSGKTGSKTVDPTDDWVTYSNAEGNFSFKHPASWVQAAHPELCSEGLALLAPTADTVGHCASEDGGQMQFSSAAGDVSAEYQFGEAYYTASTDTAVTINGVSGHKLTATVMGMEAAVAVGGYPDGTTLVRYIFVTGGRTYIASYVQQPSYPDALSDFTLLMTHTFMFSA